MTRPCEISGFLRRQMPAGKSIVPLVAVLLALLSSRPAVAGTSIYVFDPDRSTATKTGGFVGLHVTYRITGRFRLNVNPSGTAVFEEVDASLTDEAGSVYSLSLDEVFNMTVLGGDSIGLNTIIFKGKTADGTESDVTITLTIEGGLAHLTGGTTPPPNSADMFFYELDAVATRKYAAGTGEPNDPYRIATAENLITLGETPEDYDKHFLLTADIDLDPNLPGRRVFDKAVIAPDVNDDEDWLQGIAFTGVFDGNSHIISHLTIRGGGYLGLIGHMWGWGTTVRALSTVSVNIAGSGDCVGGLAGYNNGGHVVQCYSSGIVTGSSYVGGLVGLEGRPDKRTITDSHSTATVTAMTQCAGGLVGSNYGWVVRCYSTGPVAAAFGAGGLVGRNYGSIVTSYSSGSVNGTSCIGGLVGINDRYKYYYVGDIVESYSTGSVSGEDLVGGLVGSNNGFATSSFWDIETSGQTTIGCGIGKTTAEMQTASTFLEAGWDFVGESVNGTEGIWSICEGTNYPRFAWQIPAGDFVCPDGITTDDFLFFLGHWLDDNCDF
ncbi:MAG: GLUG motif-containing protein, partial [Planctomycetota bacterium]